MEPRFQSLSLSLFTGHHHVPGDCVKLAGSFFGKFLFLVDLPLRNSFEVFRENPSSVLASDLRMLFLRMTKRSKNEK